METGKLCNIKSNKKLLLRIYVKLTSDYTTKLQSSRQYGTGTKTEVQTNGTREKAQKQTHASRGTLLLTNKARMDNGAKTAFSISGAGKPGQLCARE